MDTKNKRNIVLICIICVFVYLLGQWNALKTKDNNLIKPNASQYQTDKIRESKKLNINNTQNNTENNTQIKTTRKNPLLYPPEFISKYYINPSSNIIKNKSISISTPLINSQINLSGGNITKLNLVKYPVSLKIKTPFQLLDNKSNLDYQAISGLLSDDIPNPIPFTSKQSNYKFDKTSKKSVIDLTWSNNKVNIIKRFEFSPEIYAIKVSYIIKNISKSNINARFFGQFNRTKQQKKKSLLSSYTSFVGGVISTQDNHYQKQNFKKILSSPIDKNSMGGWAAMIQHYFVTAWVPDQNMKNQYYTNAININNINNTYYSVGVVSQDVKILPNQTKTLGGQLFAGPAISSQLSALAPHLELTLDYGWLWFIGKILFVILKFFHSILNNWGWSIILLTISIKLMFFPLSAKSYKSMAKMRVLQPQLKALKTQCGDDKAAYSKATMALYKKEKVNPFGGCLPMLVQIPVFIALYWVLMETVQLRQAPFMFWIHDLSIKDPYFVLPVLMGISMFIQQRLNPAPPDPTQAKIMMFLPIFFTFMFLTFPAGLVLYWIVNNCFSIIQQKYTLNKYS